MTKERRLAITVAALHYMADQMEAVLDIDPGPHDLAQTDEEDTHLCTLFRRQAASLRASANRIARRAATGRPRRSAG